MAVNSAFLSKLCLERVLGKDEWYLCEPLRYYSAGLRLIIHVDPGFKTDFASIPRLMWRVLPKNGEYDGAAVLHDWLYANPDKSRPDPRKDADQVFREAMDVLGVSRWRREAMYAAVRFCGESAWDKHREREQVDATGV